MTDVEVVTLAWDLGIVAAGGDCAVIVCPWYRHIAERIQSPAIPFHDMGQWGLHALWVAEPPRRTVLFSLYDAGTQRMLVERTPGPELLDVLLPHVPLVQVQQFQVSAYNLGAARESVYGTLALGRYFPERLPVRLPPRLRP